MRSLSCLPSYNVKWYVHLFVYKAFFFFQLWLKETISQRFPQQTPKWTNSRKIGDERSTTRRLSRRKWLQLKFSFCQRWTGEDEGWWWSHYRKFTSSQQPPQRQQKSSAFEVCRWNRPFPGPLPEVPCFFRHQGGGRRRGLRITGSESLIEIKMKIITIIIRSGTARRHLGRVEVMVVEKPPTRLTQNGAELVIIKSGLLIIMAEVIIPPAYAGMKVDFGKSAGWVQYRYV